MLNVQCITHSSMTSPSPTIRGPVSSGGFLRASSAASASANCRLSFSRALTNKRKTNLKISLNLDKINEWYMHKTTEGKQLKQICNPTYRAWPFRIEENNSQNLLNSHLVLLFIKLHKNVKGHAGFNTLQYIDLFLWKETKTAQVEPIERNF